MIKKIIKYIKHPSLIKKRLCYKGFYNYMSDERYLKMLYKMRFHKELDLENPQTFNEKLQWLKLYDRKPIYTTMVDKCEAKKYVADLIGDEYIIPTLGVWDKFEDIDFNSLPNQFVLKCTHDSGGLVIVRDKAKFDKEAARKKINKCLKRNYYWTSREWAYKDVKPRIIAERYMDSKDGLGLVDYKFFCFNEEPKFLYVSRGLEDHSTAQISFFDLDKKRMNFKRSDYRPIDNIEFPSNFNDMLSIANKLAKVVDTAFIRVDLYSMDGKIYFSEFTFYPTSGFMPFEPVEADMELGKMIRLKEKNSEH